LKLFISIFILTALISVEARSLQVMSYNVENLFDSTHDAGKKDWTFLPRDTPGKQEACNAEKSKHRRKECLDVDWTESRVEFKLSQITDVITKNRTLPDFLGIVEIENSNVAEKLAKKLGYTEFEITDSPDERGVDVALFYKKDSDIKKISRAEHVVPVDYPTRNILEVEFLVAGKYPLTIFVNHWPSLANPDSWRIKAANVLVNRMNEILKKNPQMAFLAMGDFNTIDEGSPHPFKTVLLKDNFLTDVNQAFNEDKSIDEKLKKDRPQGTYYYPPKNQWNYLDHFFINKNLLLGKDLKIDLKSYEIYAPEFMTFDLENFIYVGGNKTPIKIRVAKRFEPNANSKEEIGFSDHFPILVKLDYPDEVVKSNKKEVKSKKKKAKH
jgi:predicted extracellular nuclease